MPIYHPIWSQIENLLVVAQNNDALYVKDNVISENRTHFLFFKLNWLYIQDHVNYRKADMVYKSLSNLAPQHMSDMF